jgi:hypothetical protein
MLSTRTRYKTPRQSPADSGSFKLHQTGNMVKVFMWQLGGHMFVRRQDSQVAVKLSGLVVDRPITPAGFMELISVRGWVNPRATVRLEGLGQWSSDLLGIRTRDLSSCGILLQPTTPPRAPLSSIYCNCWDSVTSLLFKRKGVLKARIADQSWSFLMILCAPQNLCLTQTCTRGRASVCRKSVRMYN